VAPIAAFYTLLSQVSVNVPFLDDYDTILGFLVAKSDPQATGSGWQDLVAPHLEHRLALLRAVALALASLKGAVDFRTLAWLGNLGVLALALLLLAVFRKQAPFSARILAFVPATWILFQPQYWNAFFWATSSLSNLWVLPFGLLCFHGLGQPGRSAFILSMASGGLAVLAQANGLLVLPIGTLILLRGHRWQAAAIWAVFSLVVALAYGAGLERPDGSIGILESLGRPTVWLYALYFLGAAAGFGAPLPSLLAGLAILIVTAGVLPRAMKYNTALSGLLLLVVASGLLNALGREFIAGADYALGAVRYRFYGSAAIALAYLAAFEGLSTPRIRRRVLATAIPVSLAFGIGSYAIRTEKAYETSARLEQGLARWERDGQGLRYPHSEKAGEILKKAIASGIYRPGNLDH
jgi:hypothetical protein